MSFSYGFYNGINHDRKYTAEQVSALFDGIITDGVFESIGDKLFTVAGTGMQVLVKSGKAWFNHTWSLNDSALPLGIASADVLLQRYDAVVLEVNKTQEVHANSIKIVTGIPATTPLKPKLIRETNIYQVALAYVLVPPAATAITESMIEINVGKSTCPFVTGVVQATDIDDLFNQWNGQFGEWFDELKETLSGDVVGNLMNLINGKVDKISDKASIEEAKAGTDNSKYMTPLAVKESVFPVGTILESPKSPGSKWRLCNGDVINNENINKIVNDIYGYKIVVDSVEYAGSVFSSENKYFKVSENSLKTKRIVCFSSTNYDEGNQKGFNIRIWTYTRSSITEKYSFLKTNFVTIYSSEATNIQPTLNMVCGIKDDILYVISFSSSYCKAYVYKIENLFVPDGSGPATLSTLLSNQSLSTNFNDGFNSSFYFIKDNMFYSFGLLHNGSYLNPSCITYDITKNSIKADFLLTSSINGSLDKQLLFDDDLYFIHDSNLYRYNAVSKQRTLLEDINSIISGNPYYALYTFMKDGIKNLVKVDKTYYQLPNTRISDTITKIILGVSMNGNAFLNKNFLYEYIYSVSSNHANLVNEMFFHNGHPIVANTYSGKIRFSIPKLGTTRQIASAIDSSTEIDDAYVYILSPNVSAIILPFAYTICSDDNNFMYLYNRSSSDSTAGRIIKNYYFNPGSLIPKSDVYFDPKWIKIL